MLSIFSAPKMVKTKQKITLANLAQTAMTCFLIHSRWRLLLGGLSLAWMIIVAVAQFSIAQQNYPLQNSVIQHDTGCAYYAGPLSERPWAWPITRFMGDSTSDAQVSRLSLLENGKVIGSPHALHDSIRTSGLGNYSHWGDLLYFSAPDCSDPRANGRRYEIVMQPSLSHWAYISVFFAAMALSVVLATYLSASSQLRQLFRQINKLSSELLVPVNTSQRPVLWLVAFFILVIFAWGFLVFTWGSGKSVNVLTVGGFYQVSDSMAYWLCSNNLLDVGNFGHPMVTGEWCQRRATYPSFLSGIAWIAQRNIFATLLVQALIVSVAIYAIARRSAHLAGVMGAGLCALLLFRYATVDLFALTMTENAGLVFGSVGLALLLVASERRGIVWMAMGIAMISIALNARAGAFFVLPFLVLWAGITAHLFRKNVWQWICVASIAILAGFVLQALLVLAVGGSPGSSHGNFSYTLYGLSVGGKGWQQALIDHPELSGSDALMSKAIYAFAWKNLSIQPELFLHGLQKNISLFMTAGTYGFEKLGAWSVFFKACWWLAWIPLLINRRNPGYLVVALSSLGVALSAPLLLGDGGARVFAATVAVDVLQVAIGFSWAGIVLMQGIKQGLLPAPVLSVAKSLQPPSGRISLEAGFVVFLLLLLFVPHIPLRHLQNHEPVKAPQCVNDEYTVVTRIGSGGSMVLDFIADDQKADFLKGQIRYADFIEGIPPSAWWRDEVLAFRVKSLLLAYQQDRGDSYAPGPYPVFSDQHLAEFDGRTVRLCIDKLEKQMIFGIPYRKLNSITVLD